MDNKDRIRHGIYAVLLLVWLVSVIASSVSSFAEKDVFHIVAGAINLLIGGYVVVKQVLNILNTK